MVCVCGYGIVYISVCVSVCECVCVCVCVRVCDYGTGNGLEISIIN